MKKQFALYLYGSIIIFVGFYLLIDNNNSFQNSKIIMGSSLLVASIFAFITAISRHGKQVQFAYHEMHAVAMFVYGIALIFFCNTSETLVSFTIFLFLFYAFSEITFSNWLFNLNQKVVFKILAIRALLGLLTGIGTVVAMNYSEYSFQVFGIMFLMVGINIILYMPVISPKPAFENYKA